ncbi:hypothetical protein PHLGIDRAFT_239091 [Phlebiopsis gigantea 11061_1 CR5-6]|uniref:Uncharacterized protein n=1 Tax=Phlebiopsis gigantea (strain 11061_1 CR5-6) TaxID=745531 RepID=A0A0C3PSK1_PHLG1|nr:hypothetical protein PHLGIDRAFT_239091 [Phlebiopsis gigantea 11061_1 CR5-6]
MRKRAVVRSSNDAIGSGGLGRGGRTAPGGMRKRRRTLECGSGPGRLRSVCSSEIGKCCTVFFIFFLSTTYRSPICYINNAS